MAPKKTAKAAAPAAEETQKPIDGFRIVALQVENVKKVSFARIVPKGDVVEVTGPNGSGKTTILDSISYALTGTGDISTFPVQKGKKSAKVSVTIGDFVVTRYFTAVDPETNKGKGYISRLTVEGKNREQFREPQKLLDTFLTTISFDPLAFTRMSSKLQFETLRELAKLDTSAIEAARQVAYDKRRELGRDVDRLKARMTGMQVPPDDLPSTPVNVDDLTRQLSEATNKNNIVAEQRRRKQMFLDSAADYQRRAGEMRKEAQQLLDEARELDGQVAGISIVSAPADSTDARSNALRDAAKIEPGEDIDTAELAARISAANTINNAIARAEQWRTAKAELDEAEAAWAEQDAIVKAKDAERAEAIGKAKMPLEGLGIGDGYVEYNGLPFDQASSAEQIRVSMALGMAANPKLRVLLIRDGSLLDTKAQQLIAEMAKQHGYQVWIEKVDATGKVGVVMEDGEASGEEVEKVQ